MEIIITIIGIWLFLLFIGLFYISIKVIFSAILMSIFCGALAYFFSGYSETWAFIGGLFGCAAGVLSSMDEVKKEMRENRRKNKWYK